jgi:hypothetical protein
MATDNVLFGTWDGGFGGFRCGDIEDEFSTMRVFCPDCHKYIVLRCWASTDNTARHLCAASGREFLVIATDEPDDVMTED